MILIYPLTGSNASSLLRSDCFVFNISTPTLYPVLALFIIHIIPNNAKIGTFEKELDHKI